ncbi:Mediator of RNA polymerase II transcription subunit 15a [Heracleum sosnowskyi]|uniref:Mediator of RNA polymerase II transcription subunit 15a n=1 Tax=Heracleum sosnowskyi TaxID=360622 RepID=A0AAD8MJH2_9APIA|nr:Mediator of RNA polymerase II transcription subunit 15a [Heracleum sosnowskyi]
MEDNNWRATEGGESSVGGGGEWRSQLQSESRQRIINKIMDALRRHIPFSGQEGIQEIQKIAVRFEEKIYTAAISQNDYLKKISLKMLTMETKHPMPNAMPPNSANIGQNPPDSGSPSMQSQLNSQGLPLVPVSTSLSQSGQLLPQNITNNIYSAGLQGSAGLSSSLPPINSLSQANNSPSVNQNSNTQSIPNISGVRQNSVASAIGQGIPSNIFANSQRQTGRQQQGVSQQQQQQLQNSQQYLYKQQLLKQKIHSQMQSHIQQQEQQQNFLQSNQLHSSQQSVMQPSVMQSSPLSNLQQNQQSYAQQSTQSGFQQHPQSARQQQQQHASNNHQQQKAFQQQGVLPTQQQQHLVGQSNATNIQQNQLIGQQNSIPDMQQQQHRLSSQQNNLSNQQSQQLKGLPNNRAHLHQQQLGPQEQQQHHQLQSQQSISNSLPSQAQQSQQQMMSNLLQNGPNQSQTQQQSQMMSQMQSQPVQLQQQLGLHNQLNPLHRDMQQKLQTLQQKQVFQPQRAIPEAPSTSLDSTAQTGDADGGDWQEEIYQKIKSLKDVYFLDLNNLYQKIAAKLHQHEPLLLQPPHLQQGKSLQFEKLKGFKTMLERSLSLLQISKSDVQIEYKDKLGSFEKQFISIINSNRPRQPIPPMQQEQSLLPPHMHSMQQSQPPQSQMAQLQPHENQMNSQMRSQNLQGSRGTMQQNVANLQHNPSSPLSGISNAQQSMINSRQPSSALGPGQSNSMNSVHQVATGPLQPNPMSVPQQANVNFISSQSGMNSVQANLNSMQTSSSMLPQQHLKQQEQFLQNQQLKQFQHRQMQKSITQKQLMQQQQQFKQTKLQQPAQMQSNHSPMVDHMSDSTDSKMRQQLGVKPSAFQQHSSEIQRWYFFATRKSPRIVPSPSTPTLPSPLLGESEKVNSGISSLSKAGNVGHQTAGTLVPAQSLAIGTPGISASPLLDEFTSPEAHHSILAATASGESNATVGPIERLIKVVKSMSSKALTTSVCEIGSVVSMIDNIAGSAPGNGSRAAVGEDLVEMTKCRLRGRNFITLDETTGTKKIKRCTTSTPSDVVSSTGSINDSFKQFNGSDLSYLDSTVSSTAKKPRIEVNHALLEEIREINLLLIDTVVNISDEDVDPTMTAAAKEGGEGTVVKCSFSAIALSPNLKSHYVSSQMSPIHPIRLLVPKNYPNCSPVLMDKFPVEVCKEYEDLSMKARSRFSISLRSLSQPMSIGDIAKTWDICARDVISEYAQQSGGGSFSSKYGTWENCLTAA